MSRAACVAGTRQRRGATAAAVLRPVQRTALKNGVRRPAMQRECCIMVSAQECGARLPCSWSNAEAVAQTTSGRKISWS